MRPRIKNLLMGVLLGLGAPVGSLLLRVPTHLPGSWQSAVIQEWQAGRYYYRYMTLGTTIAFGLFGYVLGRRNEVLDDLSVTDGLTRLYNHRYLQERLAQEIQRAARYRSPVTCLMLDIDDFKKVNDGYGHVFGDKVLSTTAHLIQNSVRQTDVVGRYGGEEFLVIMPQTDGLAATPLANRILRNVEDHKYTTGSGRTHVTVSIGLATYPEPHHGVKSKSALLSAADQALYKAKLAGKNQIVIWRP